MNLTDSFFTQLDINQFLSDFKSPGSENLEKILFLIFSNENKNGKYPNFNEIFNSKDSNDTILRSSLVATLRNYFREFPIGIELEINPDTIYSILGILYQKYKLARCDLDRTAFSTLAFLYSQGILPNSPYLEIWFSFFNQLISTKFIPRTTQSILKNIINSQNINLTTEKLIFKLSNDLNFDSNHFNKFIYDAYKIIKMDILKEDIDIINYLCDYNIDFKMLGFRYSLLVLNVLENSEKNCITKDDVNKAIEKIANSFPGNKKRPSEIKSMIQDSLKNHNLDLYEFFLGYFASK